MIVRTAPFGPVAASTAEPPAKARPPSWEGNKDTLVTVASFLLFGERDAFCAWMCEAQG